MDGAVEEKFGKVWTAITNIRGDLKSLTEKVLGNGIPGHEKRIQDLEEKMHHPDYCPVLKQLREKGEARRIGWDRVFLVLSSVIQSGLLVYFLSGGVN